MQKISIKIIILLGCMAWAGCKRAPVPEAPIKIGVLLAPQEEDAELRQASVLRALQLAVRELNQKGGLLGRRIDLIEPKGEICSPSLISRAAESLIQEQQVVAFFGCWSSSTRKAVKRLIEYHDHLLFYPFDYEGMESSRNIFYLGGIPHQTVIPILTWGANHFGRRVFLIGTSHFMVRVIHWIVTKVVEAQGGEVLGDIYLPALGNGHKAGLRQALKLIKQKEPSFVFEDLDLMAGKVEFYRSIRESGISPEKMPIFSYTLHPADIQMIGAESVSGSYMAWSGFYHNRFSAKQNFQQIYRRAYGSDQEVNSAMEAAYASLHLWAAGVEIAGSIKPSEVRTAILSQGCNTYIPIGMLFMDRETQHAFRNTKIGKVTSTGAIETIWQNESTAPEPFPILNKFSEKNEAELEILLEKIRDEIAHFSG